ncbi:hypothetical protein MSAN_00065700 [Mycena sanguinolenta]|uniref:DUF7918 domain-containing protein n=1 Tax=Mycena sanguinolenta TaxID=230812 RepID=A0A8H7DL97_9AGAR|nr:hypothetical protein MSAN_00065700 [Mycena sanguinolenta]
MLHCKEFAAWVSIDGAAAPEYGVEVSQDGKLVTCWIPSQLGKRFCVHWANKSYVSPALGSVYMDGTFCRDRLLRVQNLPATTTIDGVTDGLTVKPFVFSYVNLTDDDTFVGEPLHEKHGLIEIKIEPIEVLDEISKLHPFPTALSGVTIHERFKKAVTQQITLGDPVAVLKPSKRLRCRSTGEELVRFSFKYCSADILLASGIMPPRSHLKRKASAKLLDEDDTEENKMIRQAWEAKRNKKQRVKKEPNNHWSSSTCSCTRADHLTSKVAGNI